MRRRRPLLGAFAAALLGAAIACGNAADVRAAGAPETAVEAGGGCILDTGETPRTVARVGDTGTLILDDGSEAVIAGIVLPSPIDSGADVEIWAPQAAARDALDVLVAGRAVVLRAASPQRDRYGRQHVDAAIRRDGEPPLSIAAALVAAGHARVVPQRADVSCITDLLSLEAEARSAGRGLWANPAYREREAWRTRNLLRLAGTFQIVSGRVRKAARTKSAVMLNFGKDWREDFTAAVALPAGAKGGAEAGADGDALSRALSGGDEALAALEGRQVRVRGWIERRNGPLIEVRHAGAIEIVADETGVSTWGEKSGRPGP